MTYPAATVKKFPFAEKPLAVYEGQTELKATLKADKAAKPGARSLSGKLRIQACDDQVCYPPGALDVAIARVPLELEDLVIVAWHAADTKGASQALRGEGEIAGKKHAAGD